MKRTGSHNLLRFLNIINLLFVSASIIPLLSGCRTVETLPPPIHNSTSWSVKTACGIDALCLLNGLTGNRLSVERMGTEIKRWKSRLNQTELESLNALAAWQNETKSIMHSLVLKPFVAAGASTLYEVIELCDKPEVMKNAIMETQKRTGPRNTYYDKNSFKEFTSHLQDLKIVLNGLERLGFSSYWAENHEEHLTDQASRLLTHASDYNIIPEVEKALGFSLPGDQVTFYLCEYLQPFGNHLLPGVFATETKIPDDHLVRTAIHELLHDPCYNYDPQFWHTADLAWADDFIRTSYENRDLRFGYNNFGYYYVEDAVRALEQYISARLGIARPLSERFGPEEDGGMHVLAAVFYELMDEYGFDEESGGFRGFIIKCEKMGILTNGGLQRLYRSFMKKTH